MVRLSLGLLLLSFLIGCASQTLTPPPGYGEPDEVLQEEGWALLIYRTQKGTRSEGRHGVLLHDNQEVQGERGQHLETPLGTLTYHGAREEAAHLWDTTGWALGKTTVSEPQLLDLAPRRRPITR